MDIMYCGDFPIVKPRREYPKSPETVHGFPPAVAMRGRDI
jgi:hypothetical protein